LWRRKRMRRKDYREGKGGGEGKGEGKFIYVNNYKNYIILY